ncbi:MAG: nickel-dependent lactate racemase [Chthoniobacteraceae bacterium]|nr:nickel-dependent lactate racemase [Chthoniobacteraceae bacterium]
MTIPILYGHGSVPLDLPETCTATIIAKPPMPFLPEPRKAVAEALEHPASGAGLSELAGKAKSACILICDITRPVPNGLFLRPIIETLLAAGIDAARIRVLVATGLHRPNLGGELRELVNDDWVLRTVRVENHDAHDTAAHADLGTTASGTPVKIDRRFVEADLKIATGLVEPHFMAGYSGGRKVISPGIAHEETIRTFHNTRFMENAAARNCNFEGNPLHAEQLEIVRMLGRVYAVNTCLDAERRLAFVNFGEILASHEAAVGFIRQYAERPSAKRYRCVITSAAGYPLDKSYYQTIKGIVGALGILEKGGSLLIASECGEGLGSPEFCEAQAALVEKGIDGFLAAARGRPLARVDEWQTVKLVEAVRDYRVHLYSARLLDEQTRLTGATCHRDWGEAVAAVLRESGASEVAVIPEGPYVIPLCKR